MQEIAAVQVCSLFIIKCVSMCIKCVSRGVAWDGKVKELNKLTGTELCLLRGKTTTVKFFSGQNNY